MLLHEIVVGQISLHLNNYPTFNMPFFPIFSRKHLMVFLRQMTMFYGREFVHAENWKRLLKWSLQREQQFLQMSSEIFFSMNEAQAWAC